MEQSVEIKRGLIDPGKSGLLSITEQCSLINLSRSSYYYQVSEIPEKEFEIMKRIDKIYTRWPFYGIHKITEELRRQGEIVNHKRVERLMKIMGIQAIMPKKNLSRGRKDSIIYPYLLRGVNITKTNQVWSSDITYIPMHSSYVYLAAVMDWFSRYTLSWEISNTLDVHFCLAALEKALKYGKPDIFNTDQGSQFTSIKFAEKILGNNIKFSMDSRGRALDNIFIERLWRSLKYEDIYLKDYQTVSELIVGIEKYFYFYNNQRTHQSLDYKTPAEIYF